MSFYSRLSSILTHQRRLPSSILRRAYRGKAGEEVKTLSAAESELLEVAKPRSDEIFADHIKLPSFNGLSASVVGDMQNELDVRRKRLIYRSKQRGWLEVDLLLGTWASENVPTLTLEELDQYEDFVNYETIDIYNIVTLKVDLPDELKSKDGSHVVERIQQWAKSSPLGKADPAKYKEIKADAQLT